MIEDVRMEDNSYLVCTYFLTFILIGVYSLSSTFTQLITFTPGSCPAQPHLLTTKQLQWISRQ